MNIREFSVVVFAVLQLAMHTLKSWVHDLTEQNTMLVRTVEELEREMLKRVDLMHEQLQKTSLVIKRNEHLVKREVSNCRLLSELLPCAVDISMLKICLVLISREVRLNLI